MEPSLLKNHIQLHLVVILLGFTAILGALISLPAFELVWYRMLLAFGGLWVFFLLRKIPFRLHPRQILPLLGIGIVVALHWVTFFHAIKLSNVSVTLGVFASTTLFTSFIEPLSQKRRIFWVEVFIGMIILGGIYLIFQYEFQFMEGILYALLSAFLNGLFVVLNRNISLRHHPSVISFYEMIGGFLFISAYLLVVGDMHAQFFTVSQGDLFYLLLLGFVCTAYAFTAIVDVMKVLSAFTVVLAVNLEPVYGIVMAHFFFPEAERMSAGFYLGTLVILVSVFAYPFLKRRFAPSSGQKRRVKERGGL